jgi:hypothetical protein
MFFVKFSFNLSVTQEDKLLDPMRQKKVNSILIHIFVLLCRHNWKYITMNFVCTYYSTICLPIFYNILDFKMLASSIILYQMNSMELRGYYEFWVLPNPFLHSYSTTPIQMNLP